MGNLNPASLYASTMCAFAIGALVYARVQEVRSRRIPNPLPTAEQPDTAEPPSSTMATLAAGGATITFPVADDAPKLEWYGKPRIDYVKMAWHETNSNEKDLWGVLLDLRNVNHKATARAVFADITFSDVDHTTAAPFVGKSRRGFGIGPGEPATLIVVAQTISNEKNKRLLFWRDERASYTPNGYLLHVGVLIGRPEYIAKINLRYDHGSLTRTLKIGMGEPGLPPDVEELESGETK